MNDQLKPTIFAIFGGAGDLTWRKLMPVLTEGEKWVAELSVPKQDFHRITLTIPLIERSLLTVFLVAGADKAGVLKEVLEGSHDSSRMPAQLICPLNGELKWLVDKTAVALLDIERYK